MALTGIEFAKQVYDVNAQSFTHTETRKFITFLYRQFWTSYLLLVIQANNTRKGLKKY